MGSVVEELKGRQLFKLATIYVMLAWGTIQIADVFFNSFVPYVVLVAVSLFPAVMIIIWLLDLRATSRASFLDRKHLISRGIEFFVILAAGAVALIIYWTDIITEISQKDTSSTPKVSSVLQEVLNKDDRKSIAVLPFDSFSNNEEDEHFADGLSEQLLHELALVNQLKVAARTSSFEYKNTDVNVRRIAEQLGVDYILEGSVRRAGDTVRVTAQLINAKEDAHLFSQTWDRPFGDFFKIQDEIASLVLKELKVKLLNEIDDTLHDRGTKNLTAFAENSRGQAEIRKRTSEAFISAIASFKKAIELDPEYAEAYAGLAETYLLQSSYQLVSNDEAWTLATPVIENSLSLNDRLPEAHAVKGLLLWQKSDNAGDDVETLQEAAKERFLKAIELNNSFAEAYMWLGSLLQQQGEVLQGAELHKKAYELDPQSRVAGFNYGQDLLWQGEYRQAMNVFNKLVRTDPNYPNAYTLAADVSSQVGQLDQAFSLYRRAADLSPDQAGLKIKAIQLLTRLGLFEYAENYLSMLSGTEETFFKNDAHLKYRLQSMLFMAQDKEQDFIELTLKKFDPSTEHPEEAFWLGVVSLMQSDYQKGVGHLQVALEGTKGNKKHAFDEQLLRTRLFLARAYQQVGDYVKANNQLDHAESRLQELRQMGFKHHYFSYFKASIAAMRGETELALIELDKAIQEGWTDVWLARVDPTLDNIRGDLQFQAIMASLDTQISLMRRQVLKQLEQTHMAMLMDSESLH